VEQRRRFASSGNLDARNVDRPNPPIAARIRGFGGHEERRMNRITTAVACSILTLAAASGTCLAQEQDERSNIVEVAAKAGNFHTLIAAAKAAGLAETLMGKGPLTVFAPTDEAFAKLGKDKIAELLKPENKDQLAAILKYHVVAGTVPSKKAVELTETATLNGAKLSLKFDGKTLHVGTSKVIQADVEASNGVIHVIDSVLLPR